MSSPANADYKIAQREARRAFKRSQRGYPPKVSKSVDNTCLIATFSDGKAYTFDVQQYEHQTSKRRGFRMHSLRRITK